MVRFLVNLSKVLTNPKKLLSSTLVLGLGNFLVLLTLSSSGLKTTSSLLVSIVVPPKTYTDAALNFFSEILTLSFWQLSKNCLRSFSKFSIESAWKSKSSTDFKTFSSPDIKVSDFILNQSPEGERPIAARLYQNFPNGVMKVVNSDD